MHYVTDLDLYTFTPPSTFSVTWTCFFFAAAYKLAFSAVEYFNNVSANFTFINFKSFCHTLLSEKS